MHDAEKIKILQICVYRIIFVNIILQNLSDICLRYIPSVVLFMILESPESFYSCHDQYCNQKYEVLFTVCFQIPAVL